MYLERYDLDRVTDTILKRMFALITDDDINLLVIREDAGIKIQGVEYRLTIRLSGVFWITEKDNNLLIAPVHLQAISHMLLESQWRDPKVELPEDENEKVIIKYSDDDNIFIITGFLWKTNKIYFAVGSAEDELFNTEYDKMDIIGWIPAENMIM